MKNNKKYCDSSYSINDSTLEELIVNLPKMLNELKNKYGNQKFVINFEAICDEVEENIIYYVK